MRNKTNKPTMTLSNLTDRKRSGIVLFLRRCICELKQFRINPKAIFKRNKTHRAIYEYPLDVSVIICTYNRAEKLRKAVESLSNQTMNSDRYEIIVVNNGSEPCGEFKSSNIRVISEEAHGLSRARNTGGRCAEGKYLVYADDDIRADKNLLENIFKAFENHKNIGIVGGQIILAPPTPKPKIILEGRETLWSEYTVGYKSFREISRQYEFPYGANFSVAHDAFNAAGGFDERYGRVGNDYAGGEETALCFKIQKLGYKIGIEPKAVVYHHVDSSRYTKEHVRRTIRAGIFTTYRLYKDGYSPSVWNKKYICERAGLAEAELERLVRSGADNLEIFYKECEKDAFSELAWQIDKETA